MSDETTPDLTAENDARWWVRLGRWWDKPRMCLYCGETPCGCEVPRP